MITREEFNSFINNFQAFEKSIDRFGKALEEKNFIIFMNVIGMIM